MDGWMEASKERKERKEKGKKKEKEDYMQMSSMNLVANILKKTSTNQIQKCIFKKDFFQRRQEYTMVLGKLDSYNDKSGLKFSIQKMKIMAFSPITPWQIDGEKMETVTYFIFLGSTITADSDCSHEIKRCLLFVRKAMTNLDSILKSRDITLLTKVHIVKGMVFPLVMYRCESWTIKKPEC